MINKYAASNTVSEMSSSFWMHKVVSMLLQFVALRS